MQLAVDHKIFPQTDYDYAFEEHHISPQDTNKAERLRGRAPPYLSIPTTHGILLSSRTQHTADGKEISSCRLSQLAWCSIESPVSRQHQPEQNCTADVTTTQQTSSEHSSQLAKQTTERPKGPQLIPTYRFPTPPHLTQHPRQLSDPRTWKRDLTRWCMSLLRSVPCRTRALSSSSSEFQSR